MVVLSLPLKLVVNLDTTTSVQQVRQSIINSGLQGQIEDKLTALAAADLQTDVPSFDFNLKVIQQDEGIIQVYPKMIITVDTTRSVEALVGAIADYYDELKTRFRALVAASPSTTIAGWHHHKNGQTISEVEL